MRQRGPGRMAIRLSAAPRHLRAICLCLALVAGVLIPLGWALRSLYLSQVQIGGGATDHHGGAGSAPVGRPQDSSSQGRASSFLPAAPMAETSGVPQAGGSLPSHQGACHPLEHTDLPGDAVRWGADHHKATAGECCQACSQEPKCNQWVLCGDVHECHGQHLECWLKYRPDPWLDVDILQGMSAGWTSGVQWPVPSPASPASGADASGWDIALVTGAGQIRVQLRDREAPQAAAFVRSIVDATRQATPGELGHTSGTRFYRAEPVPEHWGSLDSPDTWQGGRWGPPYALLQGSLMPSHPAVAPPPKAGDQGPGARPVIRRGMVAWAGGGGGPDFFIALAKHPEWGNGHTVWGTVLPEDMALVDGGTRWNNDSASAGLSVMARPLRVSNWGSINATELVTPVAFSIVGRP